ALVVPVRDGALAPDAGPAREHARDRHDADDTRRAIRRAHAPADAWQRDLTYRFQPRTLSPANVPAAPRLRRHRGGRAHAAVPAPGLPDGAGLGIDPAARERGGHVVGSAGAGGADPPPRRGGRSGRMIGDGRRDPGARVVRSGATYEGLQGIPYAAGLTAASA